MKCEGSVMWALVPRGAFVKRRVRRDATRLSGAAGTRRQVLAVIQLKLANFYILLQTCRKGIESLIGLITHGIHMPQEYQCGDHFY